MSWIFLEIPPGNLLEICSVKFVDTLVLYCMHASLIINSTEAYYSACVDGPPSTASSLWACTSRETFRSIFCRKFSELYASIYGKHYTMR